MGALANGRRQPECEPLGFGRQGQEHNQAGGGSSTPNQAHPALEESKGKTAYQGRGSQRVRKPRPLQQGNLDALCGLYTVINAVRLALQPSRDLSEDEEELILRKLIAAADRKWRFANLYLDGITVRPFLDIVRLAVDLVFQLRGTIIALKLIRQQDLRSSASIHAAITAATEKYNGPILAGIEGDILSHWTVITGVSRTTLRIFDSDGGRYLMLRNCILDLHPRPKKRPPYWVRPYGVLVVQSSSSSTAKGTGGLPRSSHTRATRKVPNSRKPNSSGGLRQS